MKSFFKAPILLTLVIMLVVCLRGWLIKPVNSDPFNLVIKDCIQYAGDDDGEKKIEVDDYLPSIVNPRSAPTLPYVC